MSWAPDYATTAELAGYLRIDDSADDPELGLAVAASSRAIDRATYRQFGLADAAVDRFYAARWDRVVDPAGRWVVEVDDLMTQTGLQVFVDAAGDGTYGDEITRFALHPRNAAADGQPWTELVVHPGSAVQPNTGVAGSVKVTAQYGWTTIPDTITQACLLQSSRFFARREAPFGVAGSPEAGSEVRLLSKVDPDVAVMLRPYVRRWRAV